MAVRVRLPLLPGLPDDLEVRSSHPSGMSDIAASRVEDDGLTNPLQSEGLGTSNYRILQPSLTQSLDTFRLTFVIFNLRNL